MRLACGRWLVWCGSAAWVLSGAGAHAQESSWVLRVARRFAVPDTIPLERTFRAVWSRSGEALLTVRGLPYVVVLDRTGRARPPIGRAGAGPGEFRSVAQLGWLADTLWAYDPLAERLTFIARDGAVRTAAPPSVPRRFSVRASVEAVLSDGSLLLAEGFSSPDRTAILEGGYLLFRVSEDGRTVDTLRVLHYGDSWLVARLPGGRGEVQLPQPWGTRDLLGVSPDGGSVVVLERPLVATQQGSEYRLSGLSASGQVVFRTSVPYQPVPLRESTVARWIEETAAGLEAAFGNAAAAREALRDALVRPRFLPPASAIVVGRHGIIWVQREDDGAGTRWDVFTPAGERTRAVRGPPGLRLLDVSAGRALGLLRRGDASDLVELSLERVR